MELTTKESPMPPATIDLFLFFCNQEEQFNFLDYLNDFSGSSVLDEGKLDSNDRQECSVHGRGSNATYFVYVQFQKPNFGKAKLPEGEGF